jgi:hypothetical protein
VQVTSPTLSHNDRRRVEEYYNLARGHPGYYTQEVGGLGLPIYHSSDTQQQNAYGPSTSIYDQIAGRGMPPAAPHICRGSETQQQNAHGPLVSYDQLAGRGRLPAAAFPGEPGAAPATSDTPYSTGGVPLSSQTPDLFNYQQYIEGNVDNNPPIYYATGNHNDELPGSPRVRPPESPPLPLNNLFTVLPTFSQGSGGPLQSPRHDNHGSSLWVDTAKNHDNHGPQRGSTLWVDAAKNHDSGTQKSTKRFSLLPSSISKTSTTNREKSQTKSRSGINEEVIVRPRGPREHIPGSLFGPGPRCHCEKCLATRKALGISLQ